MLWIRINCFLGFLSKILKERNYLLYALDRVIKIIQVYFSFSGYGSFSLGLLGREYSEQRKQAVIKITATSCWSPVCYGVFKGQSPPPAGPRLPLQLSLSHTHTQKGWVTIYFMKYLTQYLVKIQNWGQLLNFFFLSWKCTMISYWASFKKEEIKDKLSFPF